MGTVKGRMGYRMRVLLISALVAVCQGAVPQAIQDYEDDMIREVEISEKIALDACLGSGAGQMVEDAYDKCFGNDFDLEELAEDAFATGADANGDGLPDSFQKAEVCFYKEMGWTDGSALKTDAIKLSMQQVDASLKSEFENKVDGCASWSAVRRKRDTSSAEEGGLIRMIRDAAEKKKNNKPGKGGKKRNNKGRKKKNKNKNAQKKRKNAGKRNKKKGKNNQAKKKRKGNRNGKKKKPAKGNKKKKRGGRKGNKGLQKKKKNGARNNGKNKPNKKGKKKRKGRNGKKNGEKKKR